MILRILFFDVLVSHDVRWHKQHRYTYQCSVCDTHHMTVEFAPLQTTRDSDDGLLRAGDRCALLSGLRVARMCDQPNR